MSILSVPERLRLRMQPACMWSFPQREEKGRGGKGRVTEDCLLKTYHVSAWATLATKLPDPKQGSLNRYLLVTWLIYLARLRSLHYFLRQEPPPRACGHHWNRNTAKHLQLSAVPFCLHNLSVANHVFVFWSTHFIVQVRRITKNLSRTAIILWSKHVSENFSSISVKQISLVCIYHEFFLFILQC